MSVFSSVQVGIADGTIDQIKMQLGLEKEPICLDQVQAQTEVGLAGVQLGLAEMQLSLASVYIEITEVQVGLASVQMVLDEGLT